MEVRIWRFAIAVSFNARVRLMYKGSQLLSYPALSKDVQDWTRSASSAALTRAVLAVGGSESRLEDA